MFRYSQINSNQFGERTGLIGLGPYLRGCWRWPVSFSSFLPELIVPKHQAGIQRAAYVRDELRRDLLYVELTIGRQPGLIAISQRQVF
jgi:hypothetical protein